MSGRLAEKLEALRDEVLDTADQGDERPPGTEVFDAVLRHLVADEEDTELGLSLRDAIARRLAWGESEAEILASSSAVCARLVRACERSLGEPERVAVAEAVAEIGVAVARTVTLAALGRSGRERAALMRERHSERRLAELHARQKGEIAALKEALSRARREAARSS